MNVIKKQGYFHLFLNKTGDITKRNLYFSAFYISGLSLIYKNMNILI